MTASVVTLPTNAVNIPAMLRRLADDFEKNGSPECVICIVEPSPNERPLRYVWGVMRAPCHLAGLCTKAGYDFMRQWMDV